TLLAGGWAALLIFYRVFSRPPGNGLPVSIEWGFFLAFLAAGALAYAGWRMRSSEHGASHRHRRAHARSADDERARGPAPQPDAVGSPASAPASAPAGDRVEQPQDRTLAGDLAAAARARARRHGSDSSATGEPARPRYPPA